MTLELELAHQRYTPMVCIECKSQSFGAISFFFRVTKDVAGDRQHRCIRCVYKSLGVTNLPRLLSTPCQQCSNIDACSQMAHYFDGVSCKYIPTAPCKLDCKLSQSYVIPNILQMYLQPAFCVQCDSVVFILRLNLTTYKLRMDQYVVMRCVEHTMHVCVSCPSPSICAMFWHVLVTDATGATTVNSRHAIEWSFPLALFPCYIVTRPSFTCHDCTAIFGTRESTTTHNESMSVIMARRCMLPCDICRNLGKSRIECLNLLHTMNSVFACPVFFVSRCVGIECCQNQCDDTFPDTRKNVDQLNAIGLYFHCSHCDRYYLIALPLLRFIASFAIVQLPCTL